MNKCITMHVGEMKDDIHNICSYGSYHVVTIYVHYVVSVYIYIVRVGNIK